MARSYLFRTIRRAFQESQPKIDRREFLKAAAVTTTAVWGYKAWSHSQKDPIAILGGGASGLIAALRLAQAGISVHIYEASERLGGRIHTQQKFNDDGQFVELGGELVDTNHTSLIKLAKELGLEIETFAAPEKGTDETLALFGGHIYGYADLTREVEPLIKKVSVVNKEIYGNNDLSINYHNKLALPNSVKYDKINLKEFLSKVDMASWARNLIDVAYTIEYGAETDQQSCLNLTELIDGDLSDGYSMFGKSDELMRVKGGSEQIPLEIMRRLIKLNVQIHLGHQLVKLENKGGVLRMTFKTSGGSRSVSAKQSICTIPFTMLRQVEGLKSLGLSPVKLRCIQEYGLGSNSKVMLSFKNRFWTPSSTGEVYGDFASQNFWETSRLQKGSRGILTNYLGGLRASEATKANTSIALTDLEKVFGSKARVSYENVCTVANWSKSPFHQGAYSYLKPGQYTEIFGSAGEPELKGQLLFAGEHTSTGFAGFMNGAYETGEQAAKQLIGHGHKLKTGS